MFLTQSYCIVILTDFINENLYGRYQELKSLDGGKKFDTKYNLLTLSLNIDGVETAKSASNSLYPVQVLFDNLIFNSKR